ncbi:MAG TPA: DUF2271 domain-containing protein [Steroidobacteraceae bacterium]
MATTLPPVIETLAPEIGAYSFRDEAILGTRLRLLLVAANQSVARAAALAARAEIDRLARILDTRRADSELSLLNRSREHRASEELFTVVALAERWRRASCGAFSGRLGRVIDLWQAAVDRAPERRDAQRLAREAESAIVELEPETRTIVRPEAVQFALDGIAKGWIVDRAFEAAMSTPGVRGALVNIGGDIRAGGEPPSADGWHIGIPDPQLPFDNAPLVATSRLKEHAMATSGRGPRDRVIGDQRFSPTLSPLDGWPVAHHVSASVIAKTAADADALATAMLVLSDVQALALAGQHGASVRLAMNDGSTRSTARDGAANFVDARTDGAASPQSTPATWQPGWQALATFTAPRRQLIRDPQFRSPYMAMWITDLDNKPIRTLILVGKRADWQKDNFIWWSMNRPATERLVATRSMSTSAAGVYNVFWDGVDDAGNPVPAGTYVLHVETSRERGKHTYRSLTLDFGRFQRFVAELPPTEEGGGLRVSFDHY